jgi:hypothetical protein
MGDRIKIFLPAFAMIVPLLVTGIILPRDATAQRTGSFAKTWIASGQWSDDRSRVTEVSSQKSAHPGATYLVIWLEGMRSIDGRYREKAETDHL